MPKKQSGLTRRKDSNVWQFEIRIPKDLAQFHGGKRSHRVSLVTRDYREASTKAAQLSAHWQTLFEEQRRQVEASEPVAAVTPAMARDFAQQMLHDTLTSEDIRADYKARRLHMRVHAGLGIVGMQDAALQLGVTMDADTPGAREAAMVYIGQLKATLLSPNYVEQPNGHAVARAVVRHHHLRIQSVHLPPGVQRRHPPGLRGARGRHADTEPRAMSCGHAPDEGRVMRQKSNLLAAIKTALTPQKPKRNTPLATPATASTPARLRKRPSLHRRQHRRPSPLLPQQ
jgi:hypothetical protein